MLAHPENTYFNRYLILLQMSMMEDDELLSIKTLSEGCSRGLLPPEEAAPLAPPKGTRVGNCIATE